MTYRIIVVFGWLWVIGIIDISNIGAPLPDDTLSKITGDDRYHSYHDQRNKTDAHINRAWSWILSPDVRSYRADKSTSIYDMREMVPEKKSLGYPVSARSLTKIPLPEVLDLDRSSVSNTMLGVFEKAPMFWPEAGGCTDRHSSIPNFGKAWWTYVGNAMWRSRWAATLLYTSVCMHGWHYAGARTFRCARGGRSSAVDRVSTTRRRTLN